MKIIKAQVFPPKHFKKPVAHIPGGFNIVEPPGGPEPRITLYFDNGEKTTTKLSQMLAYQPPKP